MRFWRRPSSGRAMCFWPRGMKMWVLLPLCPRTCAAARHPTRVRLQSHCNPRSTPSRRWERWLREWGMCTQSPTTTAVCARFLCCFATTASGCRPWRCWRYNTACTWAWMTFVRWMRRRACAWAGCTFPPVQESCCAPAGRCPATAQVHSQRSRLQVCSTERLPPAASRARSCWWAK